VFIPVKGRWQVFWLEGDEERMVDLDEGDVLNVPIGIYRGFRSLTDAPDALLLVAVDRSPFVMTGSVWEQVSSGTLVSLPGAPIR
jgi:hypothetical protein